MENREMKDVGIDSSRAIDNTASPFHTNLDRILDMVTDNLQQAASRVKSETALADPETTKMVKECLRQAQEDFNTVLGNIKAFVTCVDRESAVLDGELRELEDRIKEFNEEKDGLSEKGHELNCRIGYNALERSVEQTLYDMELQASMEGAKCFRDEAEENMKRTSDRLVMARLRSCQLDQDIFNQTQSLFQLFDKYDRERGNYVREMDLLDAKKRKKLSAWINESPYEEDKKDAQNILDFLNLSQQERHWNAEVIKAALHMDSFNATLNFDRKANKERMEQMAATQRQVNEALGVKVILPRTAAGTMDLTSCMKEKVHEKKQEPEDDAFTEHVMADGERPVACVGRDLHRCPKATHLASDPITDPVLVEHLEAVLRWGEKKDGMSDQEKTSGETYPTSDPPPDTNIQGLSPCDVQLRSCAWRGASPLIDNLVAVEEGLVMKPSKEDITLGEVPVHNWQTSPTRTSYAFQHHVESSCMLPDSAETLMEGLVIRKPRDSRAVSSLTDVDKTVSTSER